MAAIGSNSPLPHAGCGGAPASAAAAPVGMPVGFTGGAFAIPAYGMPAPAAAMPERFANSMSGGVILGKDGAPAGRIPAGSFVDTKDGTIFGPDGKTITLPEGSTADFFDLPDIKELIEMNKSAAAGAARMAELQKAMAEGGGKTMSGPDGKPMDHASMMQSFVDGQWGPGGVTPMKGGGDAGCGMDHGATSPATKAGGATSTDATGATAATAATTAVAGASGGGPATTLEALTAQITSLMEQVKRLTPTPTSGGGGTLVAASGAATLGSTDALRLSVDDLVSVIAQLNVSLERIGVRGGGPTQGPLQISLPPTKLPPADPVEPVKSETPKTETPVVEPPKTEVPSTSSGSGSDTTTAPPASGSSST
jgi:hypothetical protein